MNREPNILFIMADDHAANAISCYGSRINRTPNIDRIAAEGACFENCFCTNAICSPSRASILTGQYSHINGVYTLADSLDESRRNVAKILKEAGYQTAVIGKWHLHSVPSGFDYWNIIPDEDHHGQGRYMNPILSEMGKIKQYKGYVTDIITDLTIKWLKNRDENKPFFLLCHHKAPHRPWDPDPKHAKMYENETIPEPGNLLDDYKNRSRAAANAKMKIGEDLKPRDLKQAPPPGLKGPALVKWAYQRYIKDYLRCVASIDDNIGRLLDFLEKEGVARNTIVIYTSDQGMFLGEHGYFDKRFMYEESIRMPFIIRYPKEIKPGAVLDNIILNVDFAPTFLDYAGIDVPKDMQGRSFRPLLQGKILEDWRTSMYYRYWMHLAHHWVPAHYGIRTRRYKLIYYYGQPLGMKGAIPQPTEPEWELFDLKKDPHEMKNVYEDPAYVDVVERLKDEMEKLRRELKDNR